MAAYELDIVISELPHTGAYMGRYLAEVPALQGCWVEADSIEDALEEIQSVIRLFINSYKKHNQPLPAELEALSDHTLPLRVRIPVGVK